MLATYGAFEQHAFLEMWEHVLVVSDEESVWHVGELLAVLMGDGGWGGDLVRHDVVHEGSTARAGVSEPHHLREEQEGLGGELVYKKLFSSKTIKVINAFMIIMNIPEWERA